MSAVQNAFNAEFRRMHRVEDHPAFEGAGDCDVVYKNGAFLDTKDPAHTWKSSKKFDRSVDCVEEAIGGCMAALLRQPFPSTIQVTLCGVREANSKVRAGHCPDVQCGAALL